MHTKICFTPHKIMNYTRDDKTGCSKIEEIIRESNVLLYLCLDEKEHRKQYLVHIDITTCDKKIEKDRTFYELKKAAKYCHRIEKLFEKYR